MRKLIETMPHPTRVDSLSWKLKYFYESCTALEHIVVPEQKLIRVIDQMGILVFDWSFAIIINLLSPIFVEWIKEPWVAQPARNIVKEKRIDIIKYGRSNQVCLQSTLIMQAAGESWGAFPSIRGTSGWFCVGCTPSTASTLSSASTWRPIPTFPTRASSG